MSSQEKTKQETIEQAAERLYPFAFGGIGNSENDKKNHFVKGAKWQAERMYSEEDMIAFMQFIVSQESLGNTSSVSVITAKHYLNKFKKKTR
jgi:hypothetical protein